MSSIVYKSRKMFRSIDSANIFLRLPFFLQKKILLSSIHVKNMNTEIYDKFILKKFISHQYIQNYDFILYDGIYYIVSSIFEDVINNVFRDEIEDNHVCLNEKKIKLESVSVVDINIMRCINNGWGMLLEEGENGEIEIATFSRENVENILGALENYYDLCTTTWIEEDGGYYNYRLEILVENMILNIILF